MAFQDWLRGYERLLTYRSSWYPPITLQRRYAYMAAALALGLVLLAMMFWAAFYPGAKKSPPAPARHTTQIQIQAPCLANL
jgi:hypothetical protein